MPSRPAPRWSTRSCPKMHRTCFACSSRRVEKWLLEAVRPLERTSIVEKVHTRTDRAAVHDDGTAQLDQHVRFTLGEPGQQLAWKVVRSIVNCHRTYRHSPPALPKGKGRGCECNPERYRQAAHRVVPSGHGRSMGSS